jgi:hypothetical protein
MLCRVRILASERDLRMRVTRAVGRVAVAALAAVAALVPINAATAGDTTTTFTLTAGALTISQPATANLGSAAVGTAALTGSLGAVTVTDARGVLLGSWTASVISGSFVTGGGSPNETVPAADIAYASLLATATTGVGVFTPGQATVLLAQSLNVSRSAYAGTVLVGNNSATWNPSIVVTIPAAAVAGTYTGTITHSVA